MTDRARELEKMLGKPMQIQSSSASFEANSTSTSTSAPITILYYIGMILFVLVILLVVLQYTGIFQTFSFMEGDGGYIPIIRTNDAQLVWTNGPVTADLSGNVTKILPCSFTIQQDIYIENETVIGSKRRVFFYRSKTPIVPQSTADDLILTYPESNLLMYLLPNTNDLVVSAITRDKAGGLHLESAPTILNVPIRQPFRLTVIFLPQVLEVYMNGKLFGTKTFRYQPNETTNYFWGPPEQFRNTVRVMNFSYWDRPLMAMEVPKTAPAIPDTSKFNPSGLPTASCS
jgi:hypothetical protein